MLKVKKLDPNARNPEITFPGEDLGYDVFSLESIRLVSGNVAKVRTGIAVKAYNEIYSDKRLGGYSRPTIKPLGLLVRDRSSMASKGIFTHGGVIDSGYRGEIIILMTVLTGDYFISAGDKIAQLIPIYVLADKIEEISIDEDFNSIRNGSGFGSSGK